MKHSSTRAVYKYWNERRGTRPTPERADIDPAAIRHQLGDTFMLSADFVDVVRFRLAGTRVCALFNREIKGESFLSLWDESARKTIEALMAAICGEQACAVAGLTGSTADGETTDLEMLLLPLAHKGQARIRALGTLAPITPPYWLGDKPVTELSLRALRHIGPGLENLDVPLFAPDTIATPSRGIAPTVGRVRHGFVVYSGGRETPSGDRTG